MQLTSAKDRFFPGTVETASPDKSPYANQGLSIAGSRRAPQARRKDPPPREPVSGACVASGASWTRDHAGGVAPAPLAR